MQHSDSEDVEILSDVEQLYRVSCSDHRSNMVNLDRPLQQIVENGYAGLSKSITISSALEIVPPPHDVELTKSSLAIEPDQAAPGFPFNRIVNQLLYPILQKGLTRRSR